MNMLKSGEWNIEKLITHEFPLEDIESAIQTSGNTRISLNVTIEFE